MSKEIVDGDLQGILNLAGGDYKLVISKFTQSDG